jgi:hypothetical protein
MRFLSSQVSAGTPKKRLAFQRSAHRMVIVVLGGHAFFQEISQQA